MTRIGDEPSDEQLASELHDDAVSGMADDLPDPWQARHLSVQHFQHLFDYKHLPEQLQLLSRPFAALSAHLLEMLGDGPELSVCLRKLLEAKDCAVRQAVLDNPGRY